MQFFGQLLALNNSEILEELDENIKNFDMVALQKLKNDDKWFQKIMLKLQNMILQRELGEKYLLNKMCNEFLYNNFYDCLNTNRHSDFTKYLKNYENLMKIDVPAVAEKYKYAACFEELIPLLQRIVFVQLQPFIKEISKFTKYMSQLQWIFGILDKSGQSKGVGEIFACACIYVSNVILE